MPRDGPRVCPVLCPVVHRLPCAGVAVVGCSRGAQPVRVCRSLTASICCPCVALLRLVPCAVRQVRPVTDEGQLNRLATLSMDDVRPEFRAQVLRGFPGAFSALSCRASQAQLVCGTRPAIKTGSTHAWVLSALSRVRSARAHARRSRAPPAPAAVHSSVPVCVMKETRGC